VEPLIEQPGQLVVTLHERSIAHKIDRQLTTANAARSVRDGGDPGARGQNPLSGIAAQRSCSSRTRRGIMS